MTVNMRLYQRRHKSGKLVWFIEFDRGRRRSTGCLVGQDDAEARRLFRLARKEYLAGKLSHLTGQPGRLLLADFAREYLAHRARLGKSPFTLQKGEQALRYFLNFAGEQLRLADITRKQVESWLAALTVKPVSRNTYFRHLKAALSQAVAWDYLVKNPCAGVRQLRIQEAPPRCLSEAEVAALLQAETDPAFARLWRFLLATGARRSEAFQIRAEDVDRDRGLITLRHTKNRRLRQLPLTPVVAAILGEIPVQVGRLWPWHPDTVTHHFQRTARLAGLACRLHDLRHTYGTRLATRVAPWVLKELLGHGDLKTTQRYVHLSLVDLSTETGEG